MVQHYNKDVETQTVATLISQHILLEGANL